MKLNAHSQQRGATLITSLVMLVVLTLLVISAINSSRSNLRIAGNMQMHEEVVAAAQQATEQVISSNFTKAPAAVNLTLNINNASYVAAVATPVCTGSSPLTNDSPNLPPQCISSDSAQNTGIIFTSGTAAAPTSWCLAQQWDIRTQVDDNVTGASVTLHQGVSMNVDVGTKCTESVPTL